MEQVINFRGFKANLNQQTKVYTINIDEHEKIEISSADIYFTSLYIGLFELPNLFQLITLCIAELNKNGNGQATN